MLWFCGLSLGLAVLFYSLYGIGGMRFFFEQSFIAFTLLEIINYIEHYGLSRPKAASGKTQKPLCSGIWSDCKESMCRLHQRILGMVTRCLSNSSPQNVQLLPV